MNDPILEAPLEALLRPASEQADAERMWRSQKLRRQAEEDRRRRRRRWLGLAGGTSLVASAAAALWFFAIAPAAAPGPLHLAAGTTLTGTLESMEQPSSVELDDGSRILLERESRAEIAVNEAHRLVTRLRRGGATFDVTPGGPRRWVIEAGETRVEVVGTRFSVTRTERGVEVHVERGIVEVHDPSLDRVARLTAGDSLVVPNPQPSAEGEARAEGTTSQPSAALEEPGGADTETAGSETAATATEAQTVTEHGAPRPHIIASSPDEWMTEADQARRDGRFGEAAQALKHVVDAAPEAPRAAVAAFSLGRLRLDRLGAPADAARSFAFVRVHASAGALRQDATALEARARARSGEADRARSLARLYLSRFPDGRHTDEMRSLADAE